MGWWERREGCGESGREGAGARLDSIQRKRGRIRDGESMRRGAPRGRGREEGAPGGGGTLFAALVEDGASSRVSERAEESAGRVRAGLLGQRGALLRELEVGLQFGHRLHHGGGEPSVPHGGGDAGDGEADVAVPAVEHQAGGQGVQRLEQTALGKVQSAHAQVKVGRGSDLDPHLEAVEGQLCVALDPEEVAQVAPRPGVPGIRANKVCNVPNAISRHPTPRESNPEN